MPTSPNRANNSIWPTMPRATSASYGQYPHTDSSPPASVYVMLRPFALVGAALGLMPLQEVWSSRGPKGFRWCSMPELYTVIFHVLFFCSIAYVFRAMLLTMEAEAKDSPPLDTLMASFFMFLSLVSSSLNVVLVHVGAKKQAKIYSQMRHLELQMPPPPASAAAARRSTEPLSLRERLLSPLLILYLAATVVLGSLTLLFTLPSGFLRVAFCFNCLVILSSQYFPFLHAAALCFAASSLYGRLNAHVRSVLSVAAFEQELEAEAKASELPFETRRQIKVTTRADSSSSTLVELERCRLLQRLLSVFSTQISDTFTPAFLVSTPTFFLLSCYNLYQSWGMVASGADTFLMLTTLLSALNNLVCLGIISWAVDTLKGQHGSTAEEVHSCRTAVLTHDTVSALQHFSLQLIHSSPQLTVGGFFAVDRSFLLVLIGNLATYLVILLQFRGT